MSASSKAYMETEMLISSPCIFSESEHLMSFFISLPDEPIDVSEV